MARTVTVALRLFSAVFLGSGLLLVAMLFVGAGTSASPMATLAGTSVNAEVYAFGRNTVRSLFSVYAMRMAAVFTPAVSTVGIRTSAVPRWVSYLGYLVGLTRLVAAGAYQWTQLVFPAWVLLFSLVILCDRPLSYDSRPEPGELSTHQPS